MKKEVNVIIDDPDIKDLIEGFNEKEFKTFFDGVGAILDNAPEVINGVAFNFSNMAINGRMLRLEMYLTRDKNTGAFIVKIEKLKQCGVDEFLDNITESKRIAKELNAREFNLKK